MIIKPRHLSKNRFSIYRYPMMILFSSLMLAISLLPIQANASRSEPAPRTQVNIAKGGCDLGFLPSETMPTINGSLATGEWDDASRLESGGCLGPLADGSSVGTLSSSLPGHAVKVYTKRYQDTLYLGFDIDDASNPGEPALGETIQVLFDPQQAGGSVVPNTAFRLDFMTPRGSSGDTVQWYQGTGSASAPWNGPLATPSGVVVARQNRPTNAGYVVEIAVPLAALGRAPGNYHDMGMAIAFFNALSFQYSNSWAFTATQFPDTTTLQISNAMTTDTPDATDLPAWKQPQNWGTAYLSGVGDAFYFDGNPYWWLSNDIKAGFCNAANFADAGMPDTNNPKWYKYYPTSPCGLRLWVKFHRTGGTGTVGRRILALWAEAGANPQKWYYIGLTDPVKIDQGPNEAITPVIEWPAGNVPANKPAHPCIRVFLLPPDLVRPGFDIAYFQAIGTESGDNANKITDFMTAYGLTNAQAVQMNIELITYPQTCPVCVPVSKTNSNVHVIIQPQQGTVQYGKLDTAITFEAFGVVRTGKGEKKYVIIEAMGGVAKVVAPDYMAKNQDNLQFFFNVSNSRDYAREIFINSVIHAPDIYKGLKLDIVQPGKIFEPGDTQAQTVKGSTQPTITPTPTLTPTPGPICKGTSLAGLLVLAAIVVTFRRHRNQQNPNP